MVATVTALRKPAEPETPIRPYAVQDDATVRVVCPKSGRVDLIYHLTPLEAIALGEEVVRAAHRALCYGGK